MQNYILWYRENNHFADIPGPNGSGYVIPRSTDHRPQVYGCVQICACGDEMAVVDGNKMAVVDGNNAWL